MKIRRTIRIPPTPSTPRGLPNPSPPLSAPSQPLPSPPWMRQTSNSSCCSVLAHQVSNSSVVTLLDASSANSFCCLHYAVIRCQIRCFCFISGCIRRLVLGRLVTTRFGQIRTSHIIKRSFRICHSHDACWFILFRYVIVGRKNCYSPVFGHFSPQDHDMDAGQCSFVFGWAQICSNPCDFDPVPIDVSFQYVSGDSSQNH